MCSAVEKLSEVLLVMLLGMTCGCGKIGGSAVVVGGGEVAEWVVRLLLTRTAITTQHTMLKGSVRPTIPKSSVFI